MHNRKFWWQRQHVKQAAEMHCRSSVKQPDSTRCTRRVLVRLSPARSSARRSCRVLGARIVLAVRSVSFRVKRPTTHRIAIRRPRSISGTRTARARSAMKFIPNMTYMCRLTHTRHSLRHSITAPPTRLGVVYGGTRARFIRGAPKKMPPTLIHAARDA